MLRPTSSMHFDSRLREQFCISIALMTAIRFPCYSRAVGGKSCLSYNFYCCLIAVSLAFCVLLVHLLVGAREGKWPAIERFMPCCHRRKPECAPQLAEQGAPLILLPTTLTEQTAPLVLFALNVPTFQWQRIIRKLFRLRYLQRLWGNLGQFLQIFGADLRSQLRLAYPTGRP